MSKVPKIEHFSVLDLIRRHETKEITVEMEESLLDVPSLLSISRCSITASWLSGFRGIWVSLISMIYLIQGND